jgi:hypothetical protein
MTTPTAVIQVLEFCDLTLARLCQNSPLGFLSEAFIRQLFHKILSAACYLEAQGIRLEKMDFSQVLLTYDGHMVNIAWNTMRLVI